MGRDFLVHYALCQNPLDRAVGEEGTHSSKIDKNRVGVSEPPSLALTTQRRELLLFNAYPQSILVAPAGAHQPGTPTFLSNSGTGGSNGNAAWRDMAKMPIGHITKVLLYFGIKTPPPLAKHQKTFFWYRPALVNCITRGRQIQKTAPHRACSIL